MKIKELIYGHVKKDLKNIENELKKNLNPNFKLVSDIAEHIIFSEGKRLRPLLMVLCARLCGYKGEKAEKFSIIFEYLHTATLLHDDVVDGAEIRRGKKVANMIWNAPAAVLTGDFLLARSLSIAYEMGNIEVIAIIADITEKMAQGEIEQLAKKNNMITEEEYKKIIEYKTASLIAGSCKTGAVAAAAPEYMENALYLFGYNLGMAFQIVDDFLDYTSKSSLLGKESGADFKEGKLTLPIIHAFAIADSDDAKKLKSLFDEKEDIKAVLDILTKYGSIEYTLDSGKEYIQKAKDSLSVFENSKEKEILIMIADYVLERKL